MLATTIYLVKFTYAHPLLAFALAVGAYALFLYARRRWRMRRALNAARLEKRRRAGIPDSDTRPWLIARPAAELRRRKEAEARAAVVAAEAEQERLKARQVEIEAWGQGAVRTLQRLQSQGHLDAPTSPVPVGAVRRRVDRRYDDEDEFYAQEPAAEGRPAWARSPALPQATLPRVNPSLSPVRHPRPLGRTASRTMPASAARPAGRLPSNRARVAKRGRGDSDTEEDEEEETVRRPPRKTGRARQRLPSASVRRQPQVADEDMPSDREPEYSDEEMEDETENEMEEDELEMMEEEEMDDGEEGLIIVDETPATRSKRARQEKDEPRKRARKSPELEDTNASVSPVAATKDKGKQQPAVLRTKVGAPDELAVYAALDAPVDVAKQWTDAAGVAWFVAHDGTRFRQDEIRVATLKYTMPRDSEHPDARTEAGGLLRAWIEEDAYAALKAEGRLAWQEAEREEEEQSKETERETSPTVSADRPSRPGSAASLRSSATRPPRAYQPVRVGLANSALHKAQQQAVTVTSSARSASPYFGTSSAAFDRQLASPARSRLGSPHIGLAASQRRQLSEAGRAKRYDDLLAQLGGKDEREPAKDIVAAAASAIAGSAAAVSPVPSFFKSSTDKPAAASTPAVDKDKPAAAPFSFGTPPATANVKEKDAKDKNTAAAAPFSFSTPPKTDKPEDKAVEKSMVAKAPFSFGTPAAAASQPTDAKADAPKPFSFGTPASDKPAETKPAEAPKAMFSFGAPAAKPEDAPATEKATTPAPVPAAEKPAFSFGAPAAKPADAPAAEKTTTLASTSAADKPAFSFDTPSATAAKPAETGETPTFSFGTAPAAPAGAAPGVASSFSFGTGTPAANTPVKTPSADSPFSFASVAATPATDKPADKQAVKSSFNFGSNTTAPATTPSLAPTTSGFSFGKPSEEKKLDKPPVATFSFGTGTAAAAVPPVAPASASTGFNFGSGASKPAETPGLPSASTGFSFSAAPTPAAPAAPGVSTGFAFGAPKAETPAATSSTGFSFGAPKPADTPAVTAPSSFGATKPAATGTSTGFNFGSPSSTPAATGASSSSFAFGSKPAAPVPVAGSTPSFTFGGTTTPTGGSGSTTPTFAFGSAATTTEPQKPASTTSFGGFGAAASQPATTGFAFGAPSAPPAGGTSTPSFSFGTTTAATGAAGSGPASSFAFGSAATPATGSGAGATPSFSFGAPSAAGAGGFSFGAAPADTTTQGRPIARLRRGAK